MAKIPGDCMPRCESCNAAEFVKGEEAGECHLFPMEWVYVGDGETVARYRGATRNGWCRHYERKCNA